MGNCGESISKKLVSLAWVLRLQPFVLIVSGGRPWRKLSCHWNLLLWMWYSYTNCCICLGRAKKCGILCKQPHCIFISIMWLMSNGFHVSDPSLSADPVSLRHYTLDNWSNLLINFWRWESIFSGHCGPFQCMYKQGTFKWGCDKEQSWVG